MNKLYFGEDLPTDRKKKKEHQRYGKANTVVTYYSGRRCRVEVLALFFLVFLVFLRRVCHVLGICYTICTLLNEMAGKTSRCESIYSSFEQLKEFKIDVKKGISKSLKKTKHFALRIFSLQHQIFR